MEYNIRGHHIQVTDALREYVEKKLDRLEKYFEAPITSEPNVTLSVTKGKHAVEVTLPLAGLLLRAENKGPDMYAAIDEVVNKLERQIRKYKTKINHKFRQDGSLKELIKSDIEGVQAAWEAEDEHEVVRTKRFLLKPMDIDEAILQMNMVGHSFFVFSNVDTKEVNVVYKRDDGKYGLIEQN